MTDDDYDALSQKQLASIKRDMRISLEDAAVRATYKVMAELETEQNQGEEHMTKDEIIKLIEDNGLTLHGDIEHFAALVAEHTYTKYLEPPEAKQSGTISITMPAPIAYLCENATGHKYFRWKKPSSTYKPIALYTTPPQRTWVGLTDEEIDQGLLRTNYAMHTASAWRDGVEWATKQLKEKNT
jgi:hypothetical protein